MKKLLTGCLIMFSLTACHKEMSDEFVPDPTNPVNDTTWSSSVTSSAAVNQLPSVLPTPTLNFSFDASTGVTATVGDTIAVTIYGNTCVDASNAPVTGTIRAELNVLFRKGDFIRFAKGTLYTDTLINSSLALSIKLYKNNQEVQLSGTSAINIKYKQDNNTPSLAFFYEQEAATSNDYPTWIRGTKDGYVISSTSMTIGSTNGRGYEITSKKLKWLNTGAPIDFNLPKTRVSAALPLNYTNNNTAVYAVFKDKRTIVRLKSDLPNRLFYAGNIPLNTNVTFVSISKIGDNYYLGTKDATVTTDLLVKISPEKKTLADIFTFLDNL